MTTQGVKPDATDVAQQDKKPAQSHKQLDEVSQVENNTVTPLAAPSGVEQDIAPGTSTQK